MIAYWVLRGFLAWCLYFTPRLTRCCIVPIWGASGYRGYNLSAHNCLVDHPHRPWEDTNTPLGNTPLSKKCFLGFTMALRYRGVRFLGLFTLESCLSLEVIWLLFIGSVYNS